MPEEAAAPGPGATPATTPSLEDSYDGQALLNAFESAVSNLAAHVDEIDRLNVFPVPDGDTGANMLATAVAALDAARAVPAHDRTVGRVANALGFGALMGARGNSGVILSQILHGLAEELEGKQRGDAADLARAFLRGSDTAYRAVATPVEGTILTVMREASEAAAGTAQVAPSVEQVLRATVEAAASSVARTPELLAVLRQAGVVDAGGQGLYRLLEGGLAYNLGIAPAPLPVVAPADPAAEAAQVPTVAAADATLVVPGEAFGYETMFLVNADERPLDLAAMRARLEELGESVMVAGDERMARVHVHNERPEEVLAWARGLGRLSRISVIDMDSQADEVREGRARAFTGADDAAAERAVAGATDSPALPRGPAVVAVAAGEGLERALRSLGVEQVVRGGQSANPSIGEIVAAIRGTPSVEVVVLPDNPNVLFAARRAAELCPEKHVVVVPTRNVAEGIAAVLAIDATLDARANAERMTAAAQAVRTFQVTQAVRDADVAGSPVRRGEAMVLTPDDGLVASGPDRGLAVLAALDSLGGDVELVTLYRGRDVTVDEATALAERIRMAHPAVEVELVDGGQPYYHYLVAAE
ncbi:MAG TPA: DAK2 domain-containing protein [Candidatus Limnocylindrales bacterium]|nr:DAK2 domain-containing protein [Candidatus Limnocylindrales bacterium]